MLLMQDIQHKETNTHIFATLGFKQICLWSAAGRPQNVTSSHVTDASNWRHKTFKTMHKCAIRWPHANGFVKWSRHNPIPQMHSKSSMLDILVDNSSYTMAKNYKKPNTQNVCNPSSETCYITSLTKSDISLVISSHQHWTSCSP